MKSIILKITNFFFPITCVVCGRSLFFDDKFRICDECVSGLEMIDGLYCRKCGKVLPDGGENCYSCRKISDYHFENIRSVCVYDGTAKDLVHKFKYGGRDYIGRILGKTMNTVLDLQGYKNEIDFVVPVPMHWLKRYLRGYNQTEILANEISETIGKPVYKSISRTKSTKPQYKLRKEERSTNLAGCFAIREKYRNEIKGKTLLLIDDVCTTCSTIEECSKTLRRAGASKVYALTFAKD